jgi:hypothetical protein
VVKEPFASALAVLRAVLSYSIMISAFALNPLPLMGISSPTVPLFFPVGAALAEVVKLVAAVLIPSLTIRG